MIRESMDARSSHRTTFASLLAFVGNFFSYTRIKVFSPDVVDLSLHFLWSIGLVTLLYYLTCDDQKLNDLKMKTNTPRRFKKQGVRYHLPAFIQCKLLDKKKSAIESDGAKSRVIHTLRRKNERKKKARPKTCRKNQANAFLNRRKS